MTFHRTVESHQAGALTMPRERYTSDAILRDERERIFTRSWNCVGRSSRLMKPGDFIVRSVAGESIIVLRDRGGELRAFFNVCRHRGTQICNVTSGQFSETIQCPYHAWTYSTDGRLIGAPHMQDVDGFDKRDYPLHSAGVAEWEGFVFVNIADDPVPFEHAFAPMLRRLERFHLADLVVGHSVEYDVHANWKLVFQNYSECLHCPMIHPELSTVLPYQSGANDLIEGPFLGGFMEITTPIESATLSGRACGRFVSDELSSDDRRRAFYYTLMPNLMLSIHPDYVNYYLITPVAVDRTIVESEWLLHPSNTANPDINPEAAISFWDITIMLDWDIVLRSQHNNTTQQKEPRPNTARESIPAAWDRAYLEAMSS